MAASSTGERLSTDKTEVDSGVVTPGRDHVDEKPRVSDNGHDNGVAAAAATDDEKAAASAAAAPAEYDPAEHYPHGMKLALIILSLCLAVFLVALDQTIIAPALGAITSQYGTVEDIGWYGSAYLLTTTALQPMYGAIYKLFNVKLAYLAAIFIFELGSLICAVAPTSPSFIVGRAVAGIGTAGLFSGSIVILSLIMPLEKRPAVFGLVAGMWGIASVAGPLLGGAFTDSSAGWRWCFWINLPIGGIAAGIVFLFANVNRNTADTLGMSVLDRIRQLDLAGAAIFIPAIICLILALQWGGVEYEWSNSRIIGLFVGFGLMIAIFIGIQFWAKDKGTLPPRLFKNRNVLPAMLFTFFFGAAFFPLLYYLALYFQAIKNVSAVQAGIKILPLLLSCVFTSILAGGLVTAIGYYNAVVIPCMVLFAVGCGLITLFDVDTPLSQWFGFQVVAGLGLGAGFQTGVLVVQTVLPQEWVPVGTACVQFFQAFGGAIFVAVCQTLFQNGIIDELKKSDTGIDPSFIIQIGASEIKDTLEEIGRSDAIPAVLDAYMTGLRNTFYVTLACSVCAFLVSCTLQWKSVKVGPDGKKKDASPAVAV
jgi:MFS family permease